MPNPETAREVLLNGGSRTRLASALAPLLPPPRTAAPAHRVPPPLAPLAPPHRAPAQEPGPALPWPGPHPPVPHARSRLLEAAEWGWQQPPGPPPLDEQQQGSGRHSSDRTQGAPERGSAWAGGFRRRSRSPPRATAPRPLSASPARGRVRMQRPAPGPAGASPPRATRGSGGADAAPGQQALTLEQYNSSMRALQALHAQRVQLHRLGRSPGSGGGAVVSGGGGSGRRASSGESSDDELDGGGPTTAAPPAQQQLPPHLAPQRRAPARAAGPGGSGGDNGAAGSGRRRSPLARGRPPRSPSPPPKRARGEPGAADWSRGRSSASCGGSGGGGGVGVMRRGAVGTHSDAVGVGGRSGGGSGGAAAATTAAPQWSAALPRPLLAALPQPAAAAAAAAGAAAAAALPQLSPLGLAAALRPQALLRPPPQLRPALVQPADLELMMMGLPWPVAAQAGPLLAWPGAAPALSAGPDGGAAALALWLERWQQAQEPWQQQAAPRGAQQVQQVHGWQGQQDSSVRTPAPRPAGAGWQVDSHGDGGDRGWGSDDAPQGRLAPRRAGAGGGDGSWRWRAAPVQEAAGLGAPMAARPVAEWLDAAPDQPGSWEPFPVSHPFGPGGPPRRPGGAQALGRGKTQRSEQAGPVRVQGQAAGAPGTGRGWEPPPTRALPPQERLGGGPGRGGAAPSGPPRREAAPRWAPPPLAGRVAPPRPPTGSPPPPSRPPPAPALQQPGGWQGPRPVLPQPQRPVAPASGPAAAWREAPPVWPGADWPAGGGGGGARGRGRGRF
jgi:hypothetical protein